MNAIAHPYSARRSLGRLGTLSIYQVGIATLFVSILSIAVIPRFDNDIWWHLFVGRRILGGSGVPTKDFLSFTAQSHAWIDHEWLSEVGMYAAYKVGGLPLLITLFGLVTTATFMLVFAVMRARGVNQLLAVILTAVAALATVAGWGPRVQTLTLLFAAACSFALERYRSTSGTEWLVAIVVGMWLWSNLHGGFVMGFILMLAYLIGGTLDRIQAGVQWRLAVMLQKPLLIALMSGFLVTLLTPNTYRLLEYPLKFVTPNAFTNAIQESQSPNFHLYQQIPFEFLLLSMIVCGLLVRRRVSWIDVALVLVLTHMALQETRNIAIWCVVMTPVLAIYLQEVGAPAVERWQRGKASIRPNRLAALNWCILFVIVGAGVFTITNSDSPAQVRAAQYRTFPAAAVTYIDKHQMAGMVFNSYSYGGYLLWKTDAKYRVFIDSRADTVYPDSTLKDYLAIYSAGPGWNTLLQKYDIGWVFVENQAPVAAVLAQEPGWRVVFRGGEATIIVHRGKANAQTD